MTTLIKTQLENKMKRMEIIRLLNTKGNTILSRKNLTSSEQDFLEEFQDAIQISITNKYLVLTSKKKIDLFRAIFYLTNFKQNNHKLLH